MPRTSMPTSESFGGVKMKFDTATNFKIQTYGYHKRNKREIR